MKGRGADFNPQNRFEATHAEPVEVEGDEYEDRPSGPKTRFFDDATRTILTQNDSPDIGFRFSVNPYRGCEHGCSYCYARPTHEYLGLSAGVDFESKIFVKRRAPELLRAALLKPSWRPETIAMSGVTDCYQPVEARLKLTRGCLEVLAEFRNPVSLITKNHGVTRDIDLFRELAAHRAVAVFLSITTLDAELCGLMEPRTSRPRLRLEAIAALAQAGIPVGVNVAPVIPGLTDHEMPAILAAAAEAGAKWAGFTPLRLPGAVLPVFAEWLERTHPERAGKVLNRQRSVRGGKLNDSSFGSRMRGQGPYAEQFKKLFEIYTRKHGLNETSLELSAEAFARPGEQLSLL